MPHVVSEDELTSLARTVMTQGPCPIKVCSSACKYVMLHKESVDWPLLLAITK